MKKIMASLGWACVPAFIILHSALCLRAQGQSSYTVTERGPDWKVLQKTTVENGTNRVHRYTELATGLNYTNAYGQLTESKEQITLLPGGGAAATQGRHKVYFPTDIYNGVIEVVTPDGRHLKSRPLGVSYDDGSNTVFIAELKSAQGYLTSSNTVTYRDAFTGFKADLVCTYRRGGFECDLVFRQQPPTPGDYGLDESFSTLSLVTEFFDTQDPQQIPAANDDWFGLQDSTLKFGKLTMTHGKAFGMKARGQTPATSNQKPVYKSWVNSGGRKFLVETIPVIDLAEELGALPLQAKVENGNLKPKKKTLLANSGFKSHVSGLRTFPLSHEVIACTNQILLAVGEFRHEPGLVLDYNAIEGDTNDFTFAAGQTYLISGGCNLFGTTTFEPGAVIKFSSALDSGTFGYDPSGGTGLGALSCGVLVCPTNSGAVVIFTSSDDDSVGAPIDGSSHSPSVLGITYLDTAGLSSSASATFQNLFFYYANVAVLESCFASPIFTDCRFENCNVGFAGYGSVATFRNTLFSCGVGVQICEIGDGVILENVTMDTVGYGVDFPEVALGYLPEWASYASSLTVANSLVTGLGGIESTLTGLGGTVIDAASAETAGGIFQAAGNANYYLATSSPYRNVGTTNISTNLLAELQTLTTYAPQDGGMPDTNAPDLGYHYPVNEDSDHDGLPDWWEWHWFQNYNHGGAELDSSGNALFADYTNFITSVVTNDPNVIVFSVEPTNFYVSQPTATVQLNITIGDPAYYAVFVRGININGFSPTNVFQWNSTNWLSFTGTNLMVTLGATDGVYDVTVALKGPASEATETWQRCRLALEQAPLTLSISNPVLVNGKCNVIKPYLQLQGFANKPLASLSYDISNASGVFTDQPCEVTEQLYSTNQNDFTTNYFQAYDVPLELATNWITLRMVDRAGNMKTTNFNVILDYGLATNPPVVQMVWPLDGMTVSGTNITLRGKMSDETGTIQATVYDASGTMLSTIDGLVERNGDFWIENVPVNGTMQISIKATDAAGNVATTGLSIEASGLTLTIDNMPTGDALWQPTASVSGQISDHTANVFVNGLQGVNHHDGTWSATNVPVYGTGTAIFDVRAVTFLIAIPNGSTSGQQTISNGAVQASVTVERPARVIISHHETTDWVSEMTMTGPNTGDPNTFWHYYDRVTYDANLSVTTNGGWQDNYHGTWDIMSIYPHSQPTPPDKWYFEWTQAGVTPTNGLIPPIPFTDLASWQSSVVHYAGGDYFWYDHSPGSDGKFTRVLVYAGSQTSLKLYSGGRSAVGGQNLIRLNVVNANRYESSPASAEYEFPWWDTKIIPITNWSRTWLKTDRVGSGGIAWKVMPDNATADVTFSAPYQHYSAEVVPEKFKANITLTTSTTNADLAYDVPEVCVGQKVTFALTNLPMSQIVDMVGTWKLLQKYVNQQTNYSATCTSYVRNDNLLRNTNTVSCWYVNGSTGIVSVGLNLLFTNGTSISVVAKGNFSVVKPTIVNMTNLCSGVMMFTNTDGSLDEMGLNFQAGDNGENGMKLAVFVKRASQFQGYGFITQLVNRQLHWNANYLPGTYSDTTDGDYWLDAEERYSGSETRFYLPYIPGNPDHPILPVQLSDGPMLGAPMTGFGDYAEGKDDFQDYVRFQPDGDGNIPVTIGRVDWGWHGKAIKSGGTWSLVISTNYINPPNTSDDSFPVWLKKYKGTKK